ncbi:sensor histidine kinase [Oceaniglobus indicus]|uniref:sensor histidine kinase n=1 Tax=Oceaniglobus indicus TaxID=2047749 RepID=UPI000C19F989|nr:ATP-binding protein [Oceaniglobus indicus]
MRNSSLRLLLSALYIGLSLALAVTVFVVSWRDTLDQLAQTGTVRLSQGADRLLTKLESHRELINVFATHPSVGAVLDQPERMGDTNAFLLQMALTTGIERIHVLDVDGRIVAASDAGGPNDPIGQIRIARPDIRTARTGSLGFYHAVVAPRRRVFFYTRGVLGPDSRPRGFVSMQVDVAQLEFDWRVDEDTVVFFDASDVIFVSNRPALLLARDTQARPDAAPPPRYPPDTLRALPDHDTITRFGHRIWRFTEDADSLPTTALAMSRFVPQLDMTEVVFKDIAPARSSAALRAALAFTLAGVLGLALLSLSQRRQRLAERLIIEEAANATLEARVAERSEQLRRIQDELVQAGKMSALGQMSAGISHELRQPLAAIRNFADNAVKLLQRGRQPEAEQTLTEIAGQTDRMDRIIRNLSAFARKEPVTLENVDLVGVIRDSIALTATLCRDNGVSIDLDLPGAPVMVRGGKVRLQQVFVNLITNAVDALQTTDDRRIAIAVAQTRATITCTVSDTGPGLADPARVFEPFYTTKHVGASHGMGLGLSISFGIAGSFGGDLRAGNTARGACFTLTLKPGTDTP